MVLKGGFGEDGFTFLFLTTSKMTQKTVEELDAEIEQLQQKKKEMLAAVPPPRRAGFYPDYEYGNIKSLHQHVVSFALGEASELRLQAYDARQATVSYSEDVATPCTKEWFNDSTRVRVSWQSRGRTQYCVWLVDAASKRVYSYYHNNTQRFYEKAPETAVAEATPEPGPVAAVAPAPAAIAAPVAEPPTVVANIAAVAEPEKAVSFIDAAKLAREAGAKYTGGYNDFMTKRRAVPLNLLVEKWRAAVGFVEPSATSGDPVDMESTRPGVLCEYGSLLHKRPSPWHAIERAVLRNETCVLYCKHKDDGWTDALWRAAVKHLEENGVMTGVPVERSGMCYYDLFWEFKA